MRNIVFMGTGPFALEALTGLYDSLSEGDKLSVYTKESKKAGRGMKEKDGPVAIFAKEKGLPLYQPATLRTPEAQAEFSAIGADLAIVASYGLILPKEVLVAPKYGCINIHASLLPRYRGAAPINRVIMEGETITGVTLQQMDEGLDTGDVLAIRETPIGEVVEVKPQVVVKTSDGAIILHVVQPEGKGRMNARDAVNGRKLEAGDLLV